MIATSNAPIGLLDMLVGEGLISLSTAICTRNRVREAWVPIGVVLRQQGHLTTNQLLDLVQMQASEPHLRLGELAVREGFCNEQDILEAVQFQRDSNPHPVEVLLSEVECDREKLWKVLIRYVRLLEARIAELPVQV